MSLDSEKPGSLFLDSYTEMVGYSVEKDLDGNILFGDNGEVTYSLISNEYVYKENLREAFAETFAQAYDSYAREGDGTLGYLNPQGGDTGGSIIKNALLQTIQTTSTSRPAYNAQIVGRALMNYWNTMYVDLTDNQPAQTWNSNTVNDALLFENAFIEAVNSSYTTSSYFPPFKNLVENVETVVKQLTWTYSQTLNSVPFTVTVYLEKLT